VAIGRRFGIRETRGPENLAHANCEIPIRAVVERRSPERIWVVHQRRRMVSCHSFRKSFEIPWTVRLGEAYGRQSPFGGKLWRPRNFRGFERGKVEVMHRNSPNREKPISAWLA
jgi:hypothetical protein